MLRLWQAITIQKAVKHPRVSISFFYSVILHRNFPRNTNLHRLDRRLVATACTGRTTLSTKSEAALSDAQRKTIYALSTPPGKAGIAVVRVSGPDALDVWRRVTHKSKSGDTPIPWVLQRRHVVDPETGEKLDDSLTVFFKGESCLVLVSRMLIECIRPKIIHHRGYTRASHSLWASSTFCCFTCTCQTAILSACCPRRVYETRL